ncbi:PTS mannose/fructose/sorbose/N-acetylgalactosamine transporter subunit IIC [Vagococcus humatus]|uniref:PTS sugar transporter subunit IIC n=1 Tax=Vagococcus humatus TaxID=1889241 RepID=A0A3R9ZXC0_9ENTE|nr:PTS sugar transporter subunit IIC [Vagococcus humatus]RST89931.1 PTS sugar transporter subunit IIC [Vagococcus humatus]
MTMSLGIILILCLYVIIGVLDQISIQIGPYTPLFAATFTGWVMGDLQTGLMIGATLQLMTLGVATYGGATIPDFLSGAIMGTAYAIISGKGAEYGIGVAVPIGLLLTQLDILGRMCNTFFQHKADKFAEVGDYRGVERCNVLGIIPWTMSRILPVFIGLVFGEKVVSLINEMIPAWIMTGLKASGAILPAMGIAILMRYLPLKKYWPYFIIGFVLLAFGAEFFSVLGVALVGLALAAMYVMNQQHKVPVTSTNNVVDEYDDEEVEIDE